MPYACSLNNISTEFSIGVYDGGRLFQTEGEATEKAQSLCLVRAVSEDTVTLSVASSCNCRAAAALNLIRRSLYDARPVYKPRLQNAVSVDDRTRAPIVQLRNRRRSPIIGGVSSCGILSSIHYLRESSRSVTVWIFCRD